MGYFGFPSLCFRPGAFKFGASSLEPIFLRSRRWIRNADRWPSFCEAVQRFIASGLDIAELAATGLPDPGGNVDLELEPAVVCNGVVRKRRSEYVRTRNPHPFLIGFGAKTKTYTYAYTGQEIVFPGWISAGF